MTSESNDIKTLLADYATPSVNGNFFLTNSTDDFKYIRPSGNPISAKGFAEMFQSGDIVVTSSELTKIHKLDIFGDIAFSVFTQTAAFTYKNIVNDDVCTITALLKKVDGSWKFAWMHRSSGEADIATWD